MPALIELPRPPLPGLGFAVSHQRVQLDIDLAGRSLEGKAEMTVVPDTADLKSIRLNCRQCEIKSVAVNGKSVSSSSWAYTDPYERMKLPWKASVHQYHMLQERIKDPLKATPEQELVIPLPRNIKIEEVDPFSAEAQNITLARPDILKKEASDPTAMDLDQNLKTAIEPVVRFTPITVSMVFRIYEIRDGMHFVGWEDGDLRYPHAYTQNSSLNTASCLFPCLDTTESRSTWEVSIKCARTLKDAFQSNLLKPSLLQNGAHDHETGDQTKRGLGDFSEEDLALDLVVTCSGEMTDEIVDNKDPTKKTTSFICTTAVAPQHIGFAIGPFEYIDLAEFREADEDEKLGQNAVPIHACCLPGRVTEVKNTCLPMAKAIDFFSLTYGSFPFSNYKLCFVDDLAQDCTDTASLSICSNRMLFPEEILDLVDQVTRQLVHALACQWLGVYIIPKEPADTWVVVGIAYFITDIFLKKISGNNDYRFRQKRASDRLCEVDVGRPSLHDTGALTHLDPSEMEFLALKSPLVLFILDRRLAKMSGSSGISRIISRVFLNAKVGELTNGAVSTAYFSKTCERLGHAKLDVFFNQWVFGAGCPRFRVTQRFNKKKLVVEMLIQQAQSDMPLERDLEKSTFMRDVREDSASVYAGAIQPVFIGPMTIRIHEADGTPYEHIVEIKDSTTKFEIPYNTKYKRLKRTRKQKERNAVGNTTDYAAEGQDEVLLYCFGDVLQSEEEIREWRLSEWSKEDDDKMSQESYEWIRMDADFEWICKMTINMPGYMYLSQLQQDRDVVAQLESIQYMAAQREHPLVATILVRTLMDRRYFYGIRTAAAATLSRHAKDEIGWLGLFLLEKAFQELYCFSDSRMTKPNDFSNRASYAIQNAIPRAVAKIRDNTGKTPFRVRHFLYEKLRYNDNSSNDYSDCYYVATLMDSLSEAMATKPSQPSEDMDVDEEDGDDAAFHEACLEEIDRKRRIDQWIPSYHNILSITALECNTRLTKMGVIPQNAADFLHYTRDGYYDDLRIAAFSDLVELGLVKVESILNWFLFVMSTDPSPHVRDHLFRLFGTTLGSIAIGEDASRVEPPATQTNGLIIEQEASTEERKTDIARKQTVAGALAALKAELSYNQNLKTNLWKAVESPALSLVEIGQLLEICSLLYTPETSIMVALKFPKYVRLEVEKTTKRYDTKKSKEVPSRLAHFIQTPKPRTKLLNKWIPKKQRQAPTIPSQPHSQSHSPSLKRRDSSSSFTSYTSTAGPTSLSQPALPTPTRTLLKPPKKPSTSGPSGASGSQSMGSGIGGGGGVGGTGKMKPPPMPMEDVQPTVKPRLTLKLKLPKLGGQQIAPK